ncbi:hypothetical protein BH09PAT4_BH09PAT4_02760 [soil metagenome]
MDQKSRRTAKNLGKPVVSVTGNSRKLLIHRLQEIDKLSAKELAIIMADAEKIKTAFRVHR